MNAQATYRPGDEVLLSGIYERRHANGARETITLLRGTRFPGCEQCGDRVQYSLVHAAPSIYEDPDFDI